MKYFVLNKELGINRWWCNRDDSPELILDVYRYDIWDALAKQEYEVVEYIDAHNVNFDPTDPFSITIGYNSLSDIKDYFLILLDDDTILCYYPSKEKIQLYDKEHEICKVKYVLDEWSTFGNLFVEALEKENPRVLHRRKFKNRPLLNPIVTTANDRILAISESDMPFGYGSSIAFDLQSNWTYEWHREGEPETIEPVYNFPDIKNWRDIKISFHLNNIRCRRGGDTVWAKKFPFPDFIWDEEMRLNNGESKTFEYKKHYNPDLNLQITLILKAEIHLETVGGVQRLRVSFKQEGSFHTGVVWDPKPDKVMWTNSDLKVWYEGTIIPPIDPTDDDTPNFFYFDFQKQPWHNERTENEKIELLPIEKKSYTTTDFYTYYFAKLDNRYTWQGHTIILHDEKETTEQEVNTLYDTQQSTNNFNCVNINFHPQPTQYTTSDPITESKKVIDDIFNNNNVYTYWVVQPSGMCKSVVSGYVEDDLCANRTIWFLIPIAKKRFIAPNGTKVWGIGNYKALLKRIPTLGAKDALVSTFTTTIPPTLIAMSNRKIINVMWDDYWTDDAPALLYKITNYIGLFNYHYNNNESGEKLLDTTDIGVIPIEPKTIKFFMANNEFMTRTQNYLQRMNEHPYSLPTTKENEPFLYSPNCLLTGIIPQNNDQKTYLGNDYLDLSYTINNIGIEALLINNATFNYSANRLSKTKEISDARNELAFDSGLPIPENTNAYTNWLNTNSTTESTSWKVYQNNRNLRIINGVLGGISSGLSAGASGIANPASGIFKGVGALFGLGSSIASKTIQDQNERLRLNSQFSNIKASSGTNVSLPTYSASCFTDGTGLNLYTLYVRPDQVDDVAIPRLTTGTPLNQVLPFKKYFNRQVFNIIACDSEFNYVAIKNAIKKQVSGYLTKNDLLIDTFIEKYLTGIRIWNGGEYQPEPETHDPYSCVNNYEISIWEDDE